MKAHNPREIADILKDSEAGLQRAMQYKRCRELRRLQEENEKKSAAQTN